MISRSWFEIRVNSEFDFKVFHKLIFGVKSRSECDFRVTRTGRRTRLLREIRREKL